MTGQESLIPARAFDPIVNGGCDGSGACRAAVHIHGCFADDGICTEPSEHRCPPGCQKCAAAYLDAKEREDA